MATHDPIVTAVLEDKVVQAVLGTTTAGPAGADAQPKATVVTSAGNIVASPTSTEEEDRGTAGQREVNMLWENTQAKLAIAIVRVVLAVAGLLSLTAMLPWASERQIALAITAFMLLSSLSTLVIGFYYGRTNHQKVGGVMQGR